MRYQSTGRVLVVLSSCMFLLLSSVPQGHAARVGVSIQPELARTVFSMAGLEFELVDLDRGDGFDRALYTDTIGGTTILIGFPLTGIGEGVPVLLGVDGDEVVIRVSKDGGTEVVAGNEEVMPEGIVDGVECLLSAVTNLVQDILDASLNPLSIIVLVINTVFTILGCVFSLII